MIRSVKGEGLEVRLVWVAGRSAGSGGRVLRLVFPMVQVVFYSRFSDRAKQNGLNRTDFKACIVEGVYFDNSAPAGDVLLQVLHTFSTISSASHRLSRGSNDNTQAINDNT